MSDDDAPTTAEPHAELVAAWGRLSADAYAAAVAAQGLAAQLKRMADPDGSLTELWAVLRAKRGCRR